MRKTLLTLLTLVSVLFLFSDLVEEPGFDHTIIGPAYSGEVVAHISDYMHITNTGGTEEFTLIMNIDNPPEDWYIQWCHEYEGTPSLCHLVGTYWSFDFARNTTIDIDFTFVYENSPAAFDFELVWSAPSTDDIVMEFTFQTEDAVDNTPSEIVSGIMLENNYPNPFNPETQIAYTLGNSEQVYLDIFNVKGMLVKNLVRGFKDSGRHVEVWDGRNNFGEEVSSGMYFYKIKAGNEVQKKKMMLIK